MEIPNSLLRSAYQIAQRKGRNTNWDAFERAVKRELLELSNVEYTTLSGVGDISDVQDTLRATCTPLTFKVPEEPTHDCNGE